jgi:SAM-dependent methyltransferase
MCGGILRTVYDLGDFYLSDFLKEGEESVKDTLALARCDNCGLHQLRDTPDLDFMYKDHYWYRSGLNGSMLKDLKDIVENIEKRIELKDGDIVVDIGCNDGSMLGMYSNKNIKRVGFDPAPNLQERAEKNSDYFINDYFSRDLYPFGLARAKVITTIAMFYDLPDPNKFIEDVKFILDKDGIWVIQLMDLYSMLKVNGVDDLNSEHLEYYTLSDLDVFMRWHDLEIFDMEYNKVNGGSLRVYISYLNKYPESIKVKNAIAQEFFDFQMGVVSVEKLKSNIEKFKEHIQTFLLPYGIDSVYALAASTKANTMLQVMELDNKWIKAIGEVNEDKFGLRTSGTNIPIIPEKEVFDAKPAVIIVLAWHFTETFDRILKDFLERGGLALYMLPYPHVRTKDGGWNL